MLKPPAESSSGSNARCLPGETSICDENVTARNVQRALLMRDLPITELGVSSASCATPEPISCGVKHEGGRSQEKFRKVRTAEI